MDFDEASAVEQLCYSIRLSDYPRAKNRARIQNLFNGAPPWTDDEANKINVNPLGGTVLAHDARAQFYGAFLRPGRFFDVQIDSGPKHKRSEWSEIITEAINKKMKRSDLYFETMRSKFAMSVLHGISPAVWSDDQKWTPRAIGVEDIGIPSNTLLTMENLPFFYVYRSFTIPELIRLTNMKNVDKSWNMPLVNRLISWVDTQVSQLLGSNWPEVWSPEKTAERVKGDGAFYASDMVQCINCFDFYFWSDEEGCEGWHRRMILDAWNDPGGTPNSNAAPVSTSKNSALATIQKDEFLFDSKDRVYGKTLKELMSFQFADLSAIAPFRYHSVRSLGYLVYGVCQLQNRLFCRMNEAAFEASMNYFRVNSPDDADRALKIDLVNRGVIDKSVEFVKQADRWQVPMPLLEAVYSRNQGVIDSNSSAYTQQGASENTGDRKTKFQVMAEIQQTTALVGSAFNQAYRYQECEYREIGRRFCIEDSRDIDVRQFRASCLRQGVPSEQLDSECWEVKSTQVMGDGNKTMEMAISEQLLSMRTLYPSGAQQEILRKITFNLTGNASEAARWVPDAPEVSNSTHDAQLASGALMQGLPVTPKAGANYKDYLTALIGNLKLLIQQCLQSGGMATDAQIAGFQNIAQNAQQYLQLMEPQAQKDPDAAKFINTANQELGKLMNEVKGFQQRLQQQKQAQAQQSGGVPPDQQAKIQSIQQQAKVKEDNSRQSHAQKTAQKEISFESEQKRKEAQFQAEEERKNALTVHEMQRKTVESIGS